jgi:hypothetical protein
MKKGTFNLNGKQPPKLGVALLPLFGMSLRDFYKNLIVEIGKTNFSIMPKNIHNML